jgi:hypothetical protein
MSPNPPVQSEPPLFKSQAAGGNPFPSMSEDEIIDKIYNSVAISVSRYFDESSFSQPQGRRILVLTKEGIENAVRGKKNNAIPLDPPPSLRQIYALAILLLLSPAQAASMTGYSLEDLH